MKNLFLSIFEISISTSLIVLILLIFSSFLNRRYASKWNYYIWIALSLRLVIPFNINFSLQQLVIKIPAQITSPIVTNTETAIPITLQTEQKFTGITLLDVITVLWSVVSVGILFVHIFSFFHYKAQIIKKGTLIENNLILQQLFKLQGDLHINTRITIIKYSNAISPMIIGFFHPILVLPDNEYNETELFFILKHELIHLKRHDIYFKLLFVTAKALHWFNPLIYIMQKAAIVDMELSCDERVIQGTTYAVRKAYTETLLSTLHKQYKKTTILTTQFYGGIQIMKKRFKNILLKSKKKNGFSVLACVIGTTLALGMLTGCSILDPISSEAQTNHTTPSVEPVDNVTTIPTPTQEPDNTKTPEESLSVDGQEIKSMIESFSAAYFDGDTDTLQTYLTSPYEWTINAYTGTGTISELSLKGLAEIGEETIGSIQEISLEYRDSKYEDTFQYLTFTLIKQEDGWRIQFYGLEG